MAANTDSQTQRESLERDLQHFRSVIRTLREAAETTQPDQGTIFQLERAEEQEVQLLEALAEPALSAPLAGTSRLHRRAASTRCIRCAGAPRRPARGSGLSLPFRPDMPSSLTPGSSDIASVQCRDADAAFAEIRAARHSQNSRNPFHAGHAFEASYGVRAMDSD